MDRKKFFRTGSMGLSGLMLGKYSMAGSIEDVQKKKIRIAHLTDMHLLPLKRAIEGVEKLLLTIHQMEDPPELIMLGGDSIMDSLQLGKYFVKKQWDCFQKHFMDQINIPVIPCIGNHDVWGWKLDRKAVLSDKMYGKQWAMDELGIKSRFYSFNKMNWKFIVLDSTHPSKTKTGYTAKLDKDQLDWMKEEIRNTPKENHICILSHIPIMSIAPYLDGNNTLSGNWKIPGSWLHLDTLELKNLFYEAKNVKLCLSGHIHLQDKVEYLGTNYLCNGAVSGKWWTGKFHEFEPAFAIVDLFEDGSYQDQIISYLD